MRGSVPVLTGAKMCPDYSVLITDWYPQQQQQQQHIVPISCELYDTAQGANCKILTETAS